jgi:tRNA1(Val) A37 N6-methylase TrmN6
MRRSPPSHDSIPKRADGTVRDALFGGALTLWQPARGYRVNVDTLLLASFAASGRPRARRVVDLGSGAGALGLSYAFLAAALRIDFVERDASLADLANRNLAETRSTGAVHRADLEARGLPRELSGCADLVLSNPPFFETGTARPGRDATDAARRGPLGPFLRAANAALGRRAAACFVYPSAALSEFFARASELKLVPKRLRLVHAYSTSSSRLALIELRRAKPGGLVVEPPLVEWATRGVRSSELEALVSGKR